MKNASKGFWVYSLCYIAIFNIIFLPRFADSSQTMGMFILISIFFQFLIFILFLLAIKALDYWGVKTNSIARAVILFFIAEISTSIFTGHPPLFGLLVIATANVPSDLESNLLSFRKNRDFAFSMSSTISVIAYFAATTIRREIQQQISQ